MIKKLELSYKNTHTVFVGWFITHVQVYLQERDKHFDYIERDTKPRIISNKEIIERAISLERCHSHAGRLSRPKFTWSRLSARRRIPCVLYRKFQESLCFIHHA